MNEDRELVPCLYCGEPADKRSRVSACVECYILSRVATGTGHMFIKGILWTLRQQGLTGTEARVEAYRLYQLWRSH